MLLLGIISLAANAEPGTILNAASKHAIPDHYIVVFHDNAVLPNGALIQTASPKALDALSKQTVHAYGGQLAHSYHTALHGFSAVLSPKAAMKLTKDPKVRWVEQAVEMHAMATQNNPPVGLDRIDQRSRTLDRHYNYDTTASNVSVYIIDTGIRLTHTDFGGRAKAGVDEVGDGHGVNDCNGHGTHTAGIAGGHTYGVAKGATLYAVRVLDCSGHGSDADIIAGVDWVAQHRHLPAVANMSLGGLNRNRWILQ
jgi:subtilisin family serine protease